MVLTGFIIVTCLLFSLGQFGRISLMNQEVNFYAYEASLLFLFTALIFQYGFSPFKILFKKFRIISVFLGFLLFSFSLSTSTYNPLENLIAFAYYLRLTFHFLFFFYLFQLCKKELAIAADFKKGLQYSGGLIIGGAIIQYLLYPDLRNLLYLGWDPHLYRVFGTFLEPVVLGAILGLVLIFILVKRVFSSKKTRIMFMGVLLLLILLTFARGIYVAAIASATLELSHRKKRYLLSFLALLVFITFLLPKPFGEGVNLARTSTVTSRLADYQEAITLFKKHPVIGMGYNHIRYEKKSINAPNVDTANHAGSAFHSTFLTILVTSGLIGLALFIGVLINLSRINRYSLLAVIFLSVASLFDNLLLHPFVLFFLFTTICVSVNHLSDKSP